MSKITLPQSAVFNRKSYNSKADLQRDNALREEHADTAKAVVDFLSRTDHVLQVVSAFDQSENIDEALHKKGLVIFADQRLAGPKASLDSSYIITSGEQSMNAEGDVTKSSTEYHRGPHDYNDQRTLDFKGSKVRQEYIETNESTGEVIKLVLDHKKDTLTFETLELPLK